MAKKTAQPKDPASPTVQSTRRRTTRRPAAAPPPQTSAGLDGSPVHEPIAVASDTNAEPADFEPTYDQIAEAAYHRYLQRGGQHGSDFDDWVEAERSLKRR